MIAEFSPAAARELRQRAGWTQAQAAEAVGYSDKANWAALEREGTTGRRPTAAVWELAHIKAGLHPDYVKR